VASIQKRGSRWFARYRDDTGCEHGQRFDLKIDAQRRLDEQTAALATGQYADPRAGRVIFRQYPSSGGPRWCTVRALGTWSSGPCGGTSTRRSGTCGYIVAVFRTAVRDRVIAGSPCEGVRLPPLRRRRSISRR
jgi:hypothetical protein